MLSTNLLPTFPTEPIPGYQVWHHRRARLFSEAVFAVVAAKRSFLLLKVEHACHIARADDALEPTAAGKLCRHALAQELPDAPRGPL